MAGVDLFRRKKAAVKTTAFLNVAELLRGLVDLNPALLTRTKHPLSFRRKKAVNFR
ncbi:hypothetical protein [Photobacterium carnosum]|uniref:hypothetical protein n=1 Tax=Photobacterium carnosum TaxID=2023717 RepID=UPI001E35A041|nr:hypothetical protein [Photobacterium carnosum]MCD9528773.1 hypothetical protein [Photobacterium carnosum]MCF2152638.1 hypothetical protein [Photobacterium carnosum]MCF2214398.1 hypothetical protein [Photobacterium carnosum]